jgi:hypothetical protein
MTEGLMSNKKKLYSVLLVFTLFFNFPLSSNTLPIPVSFDPSLNHASWNKIISKMQDEYSLSWQPAHVTDFFKKLTPLVISESLETGVPPVALLAMAALESGYNTGYVSRITGNILSLNALQNEIMLPSLQLYFHPETKQAILDPQKLKKLLDSGILLELQTRPSALKKDYRPIGIAGTSKHLHYFLNDELLSRHAWKQNIHDFLSGRIHPTHKSPAYRSAYYYSQEIKQRKNLDFLFSQETAIHFLSLVGGKIHSFNANPEWVHKTVNLVKNMGLEIFVQEYLSAFKSRYDLSDWKN